MIESGFNQVVADPVNLTRPTYRPFRRLRYNVFIGWEKILSNFWRELANENSTTQKISRSFVGKVIIFTAADTVGALAGNAVGSAFLGEMGSDLGKCLVSSEFLSVCVGLEFLALQFARLSKSEKTRLIATTIATLAVITMTSSE